jgi:L-asparaginase II
MSSVDGANPVLVEVTRGAAVESRHRGRAAVVAADGAVKLALGDVAGPVFPRSAIKMIQALPLVETGAADACNVADAELALACASHGGEAVHVEAVAAWLARLGLDERDLECGPHAPGHAASAEALVRADRAPCRLHNNCSGKHTGFLAVARRIGAPTAGYSRADHPVQRLVVDAIRTMTGADPDQAPVGIDGCGVPTWGLPLDALALAMARVAEPRALAPQRRQAIERIRAAVAAHPFMIAGTGRLCTAVIEETGGEVLTKTGAEGAYFALVPRLGLGFALKIDDGAGRAAEVAILALLRRFGALDDGALERLRRFADPGIGNTQGRRVGAIRPAEALA